MSALTFKVYAAGDTLMIDIYDAIGGDPFFGGGVSSREVRAALEANPNASTVRVRINSEGGDVFEGMAIYNALRAHAGKKIVEIDTIAASIASIIAMAGDERRITDTGWMMIHDPAAMLMGGSDDLRSKADLLDSIKENMVSIYTERSGQKAAKVAEAMSEETWMNAEDAKAKGYVHKIMSPASIAASASGAARTQWNLAKFHNIPKVFSLAVASSSAITQSNPTTTALQTPLPIPIPEKKKMVLTGKDVEIAGALLALANANLNTIGSADLKAKCDTFVSDLKAMLGEGAAVAEGAAHVANAQTEAAAKIVEAAQAATGESDPAKLAAALVGLKLRAASANVSAELAAEVASLRIESTKGKIEKMLASNRAKCSPALEAWALGQTDVKLVADVLQITPAAPPAAVEPPAPGPATSAQPAPVGPKLSSEDEEMCAMFGTDPAKVLAEKLSIAKARG